jgi:flagellar operon protein
MTHVQNVIANTALAGATPASKSKRAAEQNRDAFSTALSAAEVKFSAHAQKRLERRGMDVSAEQAQKLARAIDRAAAKGARTSLVLLDELALLVRVPERMVVTAMSPLAMRDGVVTQIDSAVVA